MESELHFVSSKYSDKIGTDRIVFGGHFSPLALNYQNALFTLILALNDIRESGGRLGILVNDIASVSIIDTFIKSGKDGVIDLYEDRAECNLGRCSITAQAQANCIYIDWARIEFIKDKLNQAGFNLSQNLTNQIITADSISVSYYEFVKSEVDTLIKSTIRQMLSDLQQVNLSPLIFTEKSLRNIAAKRHNELKGTSYKLGEALSEANINLYNSAYEMVGNSRMPRCQAIMICLHERLYHGGVKSLVHYYSEADGAPVKSAGAYLQQLKRSMPHIDWPAFNSNEVIYSQPRISPGNQMVAK